MFDRLNATIYLNSQYFTVIHTTLYININIYYGYHSLLQHIYFYDI